MVQQGAKPADKKIIVSGSDLYKHSDAANVKAGTYKGKSNVLVWKAGFNSWIEYKVDVPQTGLYSMQLSYHPYMDSHSQGTAKLDVQIDGQTLFREATGIAFHREFHDQFPLKKNASGDDMRPSSIQYDEWMQSYFQAASGAYSKPLQWYLTKGTHVIRFSSRDAIAIQDLKLVPPIHLPKYGEVVSQYPSHSADTGKIVPMEAEKAYKKNDVAIQMQVDKGPATTPKANGHMILNTLGGNGWNTGGQQVTWKFHVDHSGVYKIAMRMMQGLVANQSVYRTIAIDGKVPFQSLLDYRFPASSSWRGLVLHDNGGNPYQFYLKAGDHTLSMRATYGAYQPLISQVETAVLHLNIVSQELNSLTGGVVDTNHTWDIEKKYPELIAQLREIENHLEAMSKQLVQINQKRDSASTALGTSAEDIQNLLKHPNQIPSQLDRVSSVSSKVGTVQGLLTKTPLTLDKLYIAPLGQKLPSMKAPFWAKLTTAVRDFFGSFFRSDHLASGNGKVLHVWVHYGRDYVNLLQQMADEYFTPKTGIKVDVSLIPNTQVLVLANAAGKQPDAALGLEEGDPVNFGLRGAAADLSQFPDFKQVASGFAPGSMNAYYYDHHYYGLPETIHFQMLFYRKDILQRLGLKVPNTWQDVYKMLPVLEEHHYNFFVPTGAYMTMMYQYGASFYNKTGTKAALNTPEANKAFHKYTDLYNVYGVPHQVSSFYQHFRDGDMPIGLSDFNTYLKLSVAAPELNGRWGMVPVPGVKQPDGQIVRWSGGNAGALQEGMQGNQGGQADSGTGGQTACMIYEKSHKKQDAWKFVKWWLSAQTQENFGNTLENYYGTAFRWNTANVKAFAQLPWGSKERNAILEQWQWYKTLVHIPGSYYIPRDMQNAWNRTVLDGVSARMSLQQAEASINREIKRKEIEFGVRNQDGKVVQPLNPPLINHPWNGVKPYVDK